MSGDPTVGGMPWPYPFPTHPWPHQPPVCGGFIPQPFTFTPVVTPGLSDADVERIARRAAEIVVELLRAPILPRREAHISPDLVAIAAETEDSEP